MKLLSKQSKPSFEMRCPHCGCKLEIETQDIDETDGTYSATCIACKGEIIIPPLSISISMRDAIDKQFEPY